MLETYINPSRDQWEALCARPSAANPTVRARVEAILQRVREQGDDALRALSEEIDGRPLGAIEVSPEEILEAEVRVSGTVKRAVAQAEANIRAFHEAQRPREVSVETAPGVRCIQRPVPIERVGLYIPGGTAPLFSTVLMLAVPANIAQCPEVLRCTPSGVVPPLRGSVVLRTKSGGYARFARSTPGYLCAAPSGLCAGGAIFAFAGMEHQAPNGTTQYRPGMWRQAPNGAIHI